MNVLTIILWITIFIIGAIAIIAVKLHFKGDELEKDEKSILSSDKIDGIVSYGKDKLMDNTPEKQFTQPNYETDVYPNEEVLEEEYSVYIEPQVEDDNYKNITYESENQVLINYGNEVERFQEPMTEMQVEIMTQDNEKHELKDLFTIDELIKESKRKDSEREKEAQQISKDDDTELDELKESIRQKKENEDKLIKEILADEEISELLASDEGEEPVTEEIEEPGEPTIQQIIEEKPAEETKPAEPTIQQIIEDKPEEETKPAEPTIQQIIEDKPEEETKPAEPTIQQIIEEKPAEETVQEALDVVEEKDETIEEAITAPAEEETPSVASQKDIAEAIDNASQEIEEKEIESISNDGENITDALLSSEEEIKEPALKTPTKIEEKDEDSTGDGSLYASKEENDLDYRKDLAKITNTIKGSKLFQDVKDRIRGEPVPETDPLADIQQDYIRNVSEFEEEYDEYAPIINETHDEFGEVYEPDYDQAIREENTRRLMKNNAKPAAPEPEIPQPKVGTIKPKPSRDSIKIKLGNADLVVKKGDEIIFKHDGETYSSQVYAINGDDISVRYRRKDIIIKPEDVKKVY